MWMSHSSRGALFHSWKMNNERQNNALSSWKLRWNPRFFNKDVSHINAAFAQFRRPKNRQLVLLLIGTDIKISQLARVAETNGTVSQPYEHSSNLFQIAHARPEALL